MREIDFVKYYVRCYVFVTSELILKTKTNTTIKNMVTLFLILLLIPSRFI